MYVAKYVLRSEYECKHCKALPPVFDAEEKPYLELFEVFALVRDEFGPITISSGYRCPFYNRAIGGAYLSPHLWGLALDLDVLPSEMDKLSGIIEDVATYFRRGEYRNNKSFIHIDNIFRVDPSASTDWVKGVRWYA